MFATVHCGCKDITSECIKQKNDSCVWILVNYTVDLMLALFRQKPQRHWPLREGDAERKGCGSRAVMGGTSLVAM